MANILEERQKICQQTRIKSFTISECENQLFSPLSLDMVVEKVKIITEEAGSLLLISKYICGFCMSTYGTVREEVLVSIIAVGVCNGSSNDVFQCCFEVGSIA